MATSLRSALSALRRKIPTGLLIAVFGVALISAAWLDYLHRLTRDRAEVIARVNTENGDLARVIEEHVRRVVMTADNALLFLKSEFENNGRVTTSMAGYVEHAKRDPILNQISLIDERGDLHLSAVPLRRPVNIADREHFKVHAESAAVGVFVGKPFLTRVSGTWSFFLTRRVNRPDGSFAGTVSAGLDPAYFSDFYGKLGLGPDRSVLLLGRDGIVRARLFRGQLEIGQDLKTAPMFALIPAAPSGNYEALGNIDQLRRFVSYRALPDYPLIVTVSSLSTSALAPFERHLAVVRFWALVFTLFVAVICLMLYLADRSARRHSAHLRQELAERHRAEDALRESQELFKAFLEHIPAAVFVQDLHGRTLYTNRTFTELEGSGAIGKNARELLAPQRAGSPGPVELRGHSVVLDEAIVDDRGQRRIFETRMFVVERAGQEPLLGCISVDSTGRRHAEEERLSFERRMQQSQKLESLGVLAGGIAHDFNNLLMVILGNTDLALTKSPPEAPARQFLRNIDTAAQRAADLAKQMLAYSGKGRFLVEPIDLSRLVEEMGNLLASVISKHAAVRYRLADGLPAVEADPTQIRQIVMNLILNASDALEGGEGAITVATGQVEVGAPKTAPVGSVAPLTPGKYATIAVSDTGRGIELSNRERIFDPFYTTKQPGRGLGLAAVLGIVRGHNGEIRVESAPGRGTTFTVLLPVSTGLKPGVAAAPAAPAPLPAPLPAPAAAAAAATGDDRGTVLIVDDEVHVLSTARDMLEQSGYGVVTAADGVEGVAVFRERCAQLSAVVLDMNMPLMDGAEAFRQMRSIAPGVPVILTSGYDEQEAVSQFTGTGLAGFLQKPYRIRTLVRKLEDAIAGAASRAS